MSMFYCVRCDNLKDSDDGCKEAPNGTDLICVECMDEEEDPRKEETEADNWYDQTHKSGD